MAIHDYFRAGINRHPYSDTSYYFQKMLVGGIFGPKKSGKTTLAQYLAKSYWAKEDRASLVFDPNLSDWPDVCWSPPMPQGMSVEEAVELREAQFWHTVWSTQNKLIICDDAAKTINRNPELNDIFTRINHNGHKLLVIGHSGVNLLPQHREQLDVIYLFRNTTESGKYWYDVFGYKECFQINTLKRYEFITMEQFKPPSKPLKLIL